MGSEPGNPPSTPAPPGDNPALGTPQQYRWLNGIVKAVLVLNLLDAMFTTLWVGAGLAREANPLLAELVVKSPVLFVLIKTTLVALGSLFLWRMRHLPMAVVGIFVVFLVYYGILLYHLGYLSWILGDIVA